MPVSQVLDNLLEGRQQVNERQANNRIKSAVASVPTLTLWIDNEGNYRWQPNGAITIPTGVFSTAVMHLQYLLMKQIAKESTGLETATEEV